MSFLQQWASGQLGELSGKPAPSYKPATNKEYAEKFARDCETAAVDIIEGNGGRRIAWYRRNPNGSYSVTLRAGIVSLEPAANKACTVFRDADGAVAFLHAAAAAARRGELDELLAKARQRALGPRGGRAPS